MYNSKSDPAYSAQFTLGILSSVFNEKVLTDIGLTKSLKERLFLGPVNSGWDLHAIPCGDLECISGLQSGYMLVPSLRTR